MRPLLTAAQMRAADQATIEKVGLPGVVLMENAGAAVARVVDEAVPAPGRIVIVCGKGNNGGDGFVVARRLLDRQPQVLLLGHRDEVCGDARTHLDAWLGAGGRIDEVRDEPSWRGHAGALLGADGIVDAILGTGLVSAPRSLAAAAIDTLIEAAGAGVPVVAVDLPSGLPSDTGAVEWPTAVATTTVTFAAAKRSHFLAPACEKVGELVVADIGIPRGVVEGAGATCYVFEDSDAQEAFPPRLPGAHKGDAGRVLIVAGSSGKSGAACLASQAALRAGAGLVTVATARCVQALVAGSCREVMTEGLTETGRGALAAEALSDILGLAGACDVVVLGPGLGTDEQTRRLVLALVAACPVPLVVDADGLNCLAANADETVWTRSCATVITPHPGEAARLLGRSVEQVQARRLESAQELASLTGAIAVLKGYRTVIAHPDGRTIVNPTGNPGMATAGSGDVLSGIVGATLARCEPFLAAASAVFVHGRAGDLVAEQQGPIGLLAGDIIDALPGAIGSLGLPCAR